MSHRINLMPELCDGDGHEYSSGAAEGCHLAYEARCDHRTTWTHLDDLGVDGALFISDFYGGTWDDDVEEHGMAVAMPVLAEEVRSLRSKMDTLAAGINS